MPDRPAREAAGFAIAPAVEARVSERLFLTPRVLGWHGTSVGTQRLQGLFSDGRCDATPRCRAKKSFCEPRKGKVGVSAHVYVCVCVYIYIYIYLYTHICIVVFVILSVAVAGIDRAQPSPV